MTRITRSLFLHFLFILFLLFLLPAFASGSENESPLDVAKRLQASFDGMHSLSFNFYQDTRGEMTGRPKKGSGQAVFLRSKEASKMRWDYSSPDKQIIISDGKTVSMYFEELHQMIVSPATNLDQDLTYAFFTGKGNVERDFHIRPADLEDMGTSEDQFAVIKLIPKKMQSQVRDIHVWVTPESLLRRLKIRDHFGTITVLSFSNIKVDSLSTMPEDELQAIFSFTPPEETEIIHQ